MHQFLRATSHRPSRDLTDGYQPSVQDSTKATLIEEALTHQREGRFHLAEPTYRSLLNDDPKSSDARYLLASVRIARHDYETAEELLKSLTTDAPSFARAWSAYGIVLQRCNRLDEAKSAFDNALDADPRLAEAYLALGQIARAQKDPLLAVSHFRKAVGLAPDRADAHAGLAGAYCDRGEFEEAMASCHSAILIDNRCVLAYDMLGLALCSLGQVQSGSEALRSAIKLEPTYAPAYSHLGKALLSLKQPAQALEASIQAVHLDGSDPEAQATRAAALRDLGRLDEATQACQKALAIDPMHGESHHIQGTVHLDSCLPGEAVSSFLKVFECQPEAKAAHSDLLFTLQFSSAGSPIQIRKEAEAWAHRYAEAQFPKKQKRGPIQRIGFVSSDFGQTSVGLQVEGLLRGLKGLGIDLFLYANQGDKDAQGEVLAAIVDGWRRVVGLDDMTVTAMVEQDNIDCLVDLTGHGKGNRLGVFANNAAAVQVGWFGYPGTTGMDQFDALIADPILAPSDEADYYTERVARMPHHWAMFGKPRDLTSVQAPSWERGEPFTFGAFNHTRKLSKPVVKAWAEAMVQVPGSRIIMKARALAAGSLRRQLLSWFNEYGVSADRVVFYQASGFESHLACVAQCDVCLDTFPAAASTALMEALWLGVPTVSVEGPGIVGKTAKSLLAAVDLQHFVAEDIEGFVEKIVATANDRDTLVELRKTLRDRIDASRLCDTDGFAEDFLHTINAL